MRWMWVGWLGALGCSGSDDDPKVVGDDDDDIVADDDLDDDGYAPPADCDDGDATVHPGADEVPYDGIDQDCADGDLVDVDGDGHDAVEAGGDDCDDLAGAVYPGANDTVGNGVDDDCDGVDGVDADGDGYAGPDSGGDDCNDADATMSPGATEVWYDNIDQDCARDCDFDQDGDGAVLAGTVVPDNGGCDADPTPGVIDAPEDCDESDPLATWQALVGSTPRAGSIQVAVDASIEAVLTVADPAATLTVTDPNGVPVAGSTTLDAETVTFTPAALLLEETVYDVVLDHACDTEAWSFTTQGPAGPVDPTLIGRVWSADLSQATFVAPAGIGPLLGSFITRTWWVTAVAVGPGTGELMVAPVSSGSQELCEPTPRLPVDQLIPGGATEVGPTDFVIPEVDGVVTPVQDMTLTGTVSADGASLLSARLVYWMDTVPMVDFIAPGSGDDAVCQLMLTFGVSCTACPDGSSSYCIAADVQLGTLSEVVATVVERTEADIAADPTCP